MAIVHFFLLLSFIRISPESVKKQLLANSIRIITFVCFILCS
ncbi:MAG: hypothetical protein JXQ69_08085 [Paludibacteraceae bacterium]|nr:hypothetical protein [Paludibacteraceae bacterium]MBN2788264.1 hypothetical protein [Paludibacteraceae bacterium]